MRQQVLERGGSSLPVGTHAMNGRQRSREFANALPATAAWGDDLGRLRDHKDFFDLPLASHHQHRDGRCLGAQTLRVSSVFDVAARIELAIAAACVYHNMIETALEALEGTTIPVAAVSTAFPDGLTPMDLRLKEIEASVAAGAQEIDIVIERRLVLGRTLAGSLRSGSSLSPGLRRGPHEDNSGDRAAGNPA